MNSSLTSQGVGNKWEDHQNKADFLHKHKQLLMTLKLLFKLFTQEKWELFLLKSVKR